MSYEAQQVRERWFGPDGQHAIIHEQYGEFSEILCDECGEFVDGKGHRVLNSLTLCKAHATCECGAVADTVLEDGITCGPCAMKYIADREADAIDRAVDDAEERKLEADDRAEFENSRYSTNHPAYFLDTTTPEDAPCPF